ncbi:hypothetical protein B2A_05269, partial [mine drainage metagenome]
QDTSHPHGSHLRVQWPPERHIRRAYQCVDLINRYSTDPVLVLDDTILPRKGKHIEGAGWVFDHSEGRSVCGMQYATAIISGNEGIFLLNLDLRQGKGR